MRLARPGRVGSDVWQLDQETFEYIERDLHKDPILPLTVGKMGKSDRRYNPGILMVPEERREAHTREAAQRWVEKRQTISLYDPLSGETKDWQTVLYNSPHWWVCDPERPIIVDRKREKDLEED